MVFRRTRNHHILRSVAADGTAAEIWTYYSSEDRTAGMGQSGVRHFLVD